MGEGGTSERTRVRRLPDKQVHDRAALDAILDAGRVAHVAALDALAPPDAGQAISAAQPYVLPVAYARDRDTVLIHGSTASRLFRALAGGAPTCLTVTLLDGLLLARSVFESSMHYRCAMVLGQAQQLDGEAKVSALHSLSEHLMPGRWNDARRPNHKELAATLVLALPLDEWSVKVSDGPPDDAEEDLALPVWAGVVPIAEVLGAPKAAADVRPDVAVPAYVASWRTA